MREVHSDGKIRVGAMEEPFEGGSARDKYRIETVSDSPAAPASFTLAYLKFQHGPIQEVGVNGITNESLLAIVADRLKGFQNGPYACVYNDLALRNVESALAMLQTRTAERKARGVEGLNEA